VSTSEIDIQPVLKGDLIELRPLRQDDFDLLYEVASDPLIWEQHPERERYKKEIFQRFFDGAMESKGAFAILDRKTGRIIGSSRYCNLNLAEHELEIGWTFLARAYWGGAYNGELKKLMLDHAFRYVDRVLFVIGERNLRSQKAVEKIGARFVKKVEQPTRYRGIATRVIYAITREGTKPG
jgi:RimJ/RimL family protein N-acetyltransferase